jgi:hypothetical protein
MTRSMLRSTVLAAAAGIATAGGATAQNKTVTAYNLATGSTVVVPVSASQSNLPARPVSASQAGTPSITPLNPVAPLGSATDPSTAAAINSVNATVMDLLAPRTTKAARIRELQSLLAIVTQLERLNFPAAQMAQLRQIDAELTARLALLMQ